MSLLASDIYKLCVLCSHSAAENVVYCDIKVAFSAREDLLLLKNNNENMSPGRRCVCAAGCIAIGAIRTKWASRSDTAIGAHGRLRLPAGAWFIARTRRRGSFVCKLFDKLTERAHCGDLMASCALDFLLSLSTLDEYREYKKEEFSEQQYEPPGLGCLSYDPIHRCTIKIFHDPVLWYAISKTV